MGFFDFLKEESKPTTDYEERAYSTSITSFYGLTSTGKEEVMKIPVVQSILEIIGGTIAQLPIYLYKDNGDGSIEKVEDYREKLLNEEPNPMQNAYNYKKSMVIDILLHGGSYSCIDKVRNEVVGLYNLNTDNLTVKLYKKKSYKIDDADIIINGDCGQEVFKPHELLICLKDSKDGITSKGALYYGKDIFNVVAEELKYSKSIYKNGTLPLGVLQAKGRMTADVIARLRDSWSKLYSGSENAGKTVILEEGLEYKPVSLNPRDLLLNENKKDNLSDICRLFNIPESLVNPNANKYGSLEQNNIFFLQYCLSPIISTIENGLNKSLLLEEEKDQGFFWAFDTSEVLRMTEKERYDALKVGLDAGVITMNEARYKLNLKGIRDDVMKWSLGDILYYPATGEMKIPNMGLIDDASKEAYAEKNNKNNKEKEVKEDEQTDTSNEDDNSTSDKKL